MHNYKYWIALDAVKGIGPGNLKEIYSALEKLNLSITDLFDLEPSEISGELHFSDKIVNAVSEAKKLIDRIEEDYIAMLDSGIKIIPFFSARYPRRLTEILETGLPPFLYVFGNDTLLSVKGIAVLGDMNISEKGKMITYIASRDLSRHKISIISGLAAGTDIIAHRSSLENGGTTIAFVPYGIFRLKIPSALQDAYDAERMAIVSTFYPDAEPTKYTALARNRTAAALAYAVYIVEAPNDGGIFEAAKSAKNLGIPLFTTEYSEYPKNAGGNKKIIEELGGFPVRGKKEGDLIVPNIDRLVSYIKFPAE